MMSIFNRAFIAARITLAFSNGFHPHPRVAFGPPLPFGVIGLSELFDIVTSMPVPLNELLLINKWLPKELKVRNCMQLNIKEESLNALIAGAEYEFSPSFKISGQELEHIVENALSKPEVLITIKENDKQTVNTIKNIRPFIRSMCVRKNGADALIAAVLSHAPKATCRPSELITGLFPDHQWTDFIVCRKECLKNEAGNLISLW
jgi:radical SAM-linked protein